MIKLNTVYKAGKQEVKFQEKKSGLFYAEYGHETVEGKMEGNTLKGIFHNKKVNVTGLMELTFHETGFEGRWKKGIEPGELKQKWNAVLVEDKNPTNESKNGYHVFEGEDNIRYEGEWENDEFISGKAEYVDEDGVKVIEEGEFKDIIITSGKITYENGTIEEGTFDEEGVLHGQGKQTYLDEDGVKVIEEGNFDHSVLKEGKITWADGNCASGVFDEELELNGKGIYTWENGDFQDGTWVHGEFKDGKAKITHDDGEISEGMMKDGEWVEEEVLNSDELLLRKSFQVGDKVHLPITQMGEELDFEKIDSGSGNIKSALDDGQSFLYITFAISDGKICYEGDEIPRSEEQILYGLNNRLNKEGNPFWKEDLILFNENNLKNFNLPFFEKIKSEIESNQSSNKISVVNEPNLLSSYDRPEKSPIRSLAANMNKLFDKQDYEGVCIYADLSREYPNDVFDKILISAVKTLNNQMFNECKSKFDARDIIWDFEGENRKFKVKWLVFFDENKKLLNKNNEMKLFADLTKYENEIKEEILIFKTKVYESIEYDSGEKYNGEMLDHKRNGKGIYTWPNGQRYEGDFLNNCLHGKGTYTWPDGQQYIGDWVKGKRHGNGIQSQSNGAWKEGTWENDKFISGKGKWIFDGGDTYEGERSQGAWNGKGKYIWADGDSYEGGWKDGKILGKTKHQLENEQKQREEDERRYSEEMARREQEQLRHNEEMAKREADELERKKVQEKKKVEEDELERKKAQEKKEKQEKEEKINNTSHNFKIKVKHYWAPKGELACSKCGILIGRWKNGGSRGCKGSHNVLLSTEVCKKCGKSINKIEYHPECKND